MFRKAQRRIAVVQTVKMSLLGWLFYDVRPVALAMNDSARGFLFTLLNFYCISYTAKKFSQLEVQVFFPRKEKKHYKPQPHISVSYTGQTAGTLDL